MSTPNDIGYEVFHLLRGQWFSEYQAQLITAQAAHETANFTSPVFVNSNNCFGFKFTGHKLEIGDYHGYGKYKSIGDCVKRYADYYTRFKYPGTHLSVEHFVGNLKSKQYFEAPIEEYITGVKYYMKIYFNE